VSVTILDVAKKAGVGVGTVSRVINSATHVRPATRATIESAMRDLGYHPNAQARNLKRRTVTTLGFFFNSGGRRLSDPFFNVLMAGIADACGDRNYDLLVASCRNAADELVALERLIKSNRVCGVILTDSRVRDARIALLEAEQFPCAVLGRPGGKTQSTVSVDLDNRRAIIEAVSWLFARGHQRVGFIGPSDDGTCSRDRMSGYRAAHTVAQRAIDPRLITHTGITEEDGASAMCALLALQPRPTAVVACSDVIAFGAMRAITHSGLRVGKDIAVIGFDDIPAAAFTSPALATVRQPIYDMGETLAGMLIDFVHSEGICQGPRIIAPELVLRESAGV